MSRRIVANPEIPCGQPSSRGMRTSIESIRELTARGADPEEILKAYLQLADEQARPFSAEEAREVSALLRKSLVGRITSDSADLIREDRER